MDKDQTQATVLDDDLTEETFNDAIESLSKSLEKAGTGHPMTKEKMKKGKRGDDEGVEKARDEDDDRDDDDSEEEEIITEEYEKSIADYLAENPEAQAAIDVEPFLLQIAKSIDESISELRKSINTRIGVIEDLVKSQSEVVMNTARLEKSAHDMLTQIGGQAVRSTSARVLQKGRFDTEMPQINSNEVLQKSREWVKTKDINLTEAGNIENRHNKGIAFGTVGDRLDQKVVALMKRKEG